MASIHMGHVLALDQTEVCLCCTSMVVHLEGHGATSGPIPCQLSQLRRRPGPADQRLLTAVH
jgi:hypothetical protein